LKEKLIELIMFTTLSASPGVSAQQVLIDAPQNLPTPAPIVQPIEAPVLVPVVPVAPIPVPPPAPKPKPQPKPVVPQNVAGNSYTPGNCTWYVKSRRPDMPNNLGNAITWVNRAASQGFSTGSQARVGAVGQKSNHVVYVVAVNGSQMTISEMNYQGLYKVSSRTVAVSGWRFIY
jgi:hypothetical protein